MADDNRRQPQLPNVRPPDEFSFTPSEWSNWRARWAQYHMLSNLKNQSAEYQANSLLYSMGPRAIQVVETFNLTTAQKKDHDALLDAFDGLYKATKNTVYDRAQFFRRAQQQGEPAADFILDVKRLATPCEFGTLKDSLIRDRIVIGIADEALSQALQLDAALDLEKCVQRVLHAEQVSQNSAVARDINGNGKEVHKVTLKKKPPPKQQQNKKIWTCKYCGRNVKHNNPKECPAFGKKCNSCGGQNHFGSVCLKKLRKVNELEEPEDCGEDEGSAAINSVTKARFGPSPYLGEVKQSIWEAGVEYVEYQPLLLDIQVGKLGELEFKADSGADAPVMGKEYLSQLGPVKLQKCGPLRAAGDLTLEVHGKFKTSLQWQDKHHEVWVYVLERQQKPLLGRPTMIKFGLIDLSVYKPVKVLATQHSSKQATALPEMEHPEIFKGLGVMPARLGSKQKVVVMMDDIFIFADNRSEHDDILRLVLNKLLAAGVTLNKAKCQFRVEECKELHTPDILSRAPLPDRPGDKDILLEELGVAELASANIDSMPMSSSRMKQLRQAQLEDPVCKQLKVYILQGWPRDQNDLPNALKPFHAARNELNIQVDLVCKGKELHTPDILSRAPLPDRPGDKDILLEELGVAELASANIDSMPMSSSRMKQLRQAQLEDPVCKQLKVYILQGWPRDQNDLPNALKPFHAARNELNIQVDLVCKGNQIFVPNSLQPIMLQGLHTGHLSVDKCRSRAASSVWWPSMSTQLSQLIEKCSVCIQRKKQRPEPLLPTPLASRPWEMIAMDFADCKGRKYLIVVDYFSTYPFAIQMQKTTAAPVIAQSENLFAMFGSPETIRSDNGPPFNSWDFTKFCELWDINHITSSPHFPQSNGKAEAAVKAIKDLIQRGDLLTGLLAFRDAKLKNGFTPAQLFLGRQLRTTVPSLPTRLEPSWPDLPQLRTMLQERSAAVKRRYDQARRAKELEPLEVNTQVWIPDLNCYGTIAGTADTPRSYFVTVGGRTLRRNRRHLLDAKAAVLRLGPYQYPPISAQPPDRPPPSPTTARVTSTKRRSFSPGGKGRATSRPTREHKKPGHLQDFVLDKRTEDLYILN
ncbi:hypothetical protein KUF71_014185 [Frankliniella fusca]|uniref:RNA-directed DNA polymerase n=1 Tax=Frankliniella fusca TaxID=407009 RepID=A0AAE1HSD7_9NEOP|nr:hypothetical protein KUF71_014185 [Frankliniella fusca]